MPKEPDHNRVVDPVLIIDGRVASAYINGVGINVSTVDRWNDELTKRFIQEQANVHGGYQSTSASISHFFGETFNASNRKLVHDFLNEHDLEGGKAALITDSKLMRGALVAYSWLSKSDIKSFAPDDIEALCAWVAKDTAADSAVLQSALSGCYKLLRVESKKAI